MLKLEIVCSSIFLLCTPFVYTGTGVDFKNRTDYEIRLAPLKFSLAQGISSSPEVVIKPQSTHKNIVSLERIFGNNISGGDTIEYTQQIEVKIQDTWYVIGEISQQVRFKTIAGSSFNYSIKLASAVKPTKEFNPLYDFSQQKTETQNRIQQTATVSFSNNIVTFTLSAERIKNSFWRNDDIEYELQASTQKKP